MEPLNINVHQHTDWAHPCTPHKAQPQSSKRPRKQTHTQVTGLYISLHILDKMHGRSLRKTGGTVPPHIVGGGRPMHPSPQYLEK